VVINRSADYLARHGTPYLPANLITDWQHYNPYLPLMELFGLPREAGFPGLLGDPRIWTSLVTVAALTAAFALVVPGVGRDHGRAVAVLAAISVSSPLVAFPLTVGVTDPPIIALTCLTLALAARGQFLRAALILAVACAMKSTAWAVVPVLAVMTWVSDSYRTAVKFTGTVIGAAVVLALAAAPNSLATPDAIRQNLIDYPLGTSKFKTVAASPLPGHLISDLGHAGHLTVDALLLLALIAFAAWLLARPPRDARDATVRLIVLYAVLFTLAPSTRYGYYAYPLALVGWLALTRSPASGKEQLLGQAPVNRGGPLALQELVGAAEGAGAEESVLRGHGARVHGLDARETAQHRAELPGRAAPQDGHQRHVPLGESADCLLGDRFPALALVTIRFAGLDREHPVEQQDALLRPRRQVAVRRARVAEIIRILAKDVEKGGRQPLDAWVDREAEAYRVARGGVRILADDQHAHVVERLLEGAQYLVTRGKVSLARGDLLAQELAHPRDLVLNWGEGVRPARFHDVAQRLRHAQKIAQATDKTRGHGPGARQHPDAFPNAR
jgi:hypothetical protein